MDKVKHLGHGLSNSLHRALESGLNNQFLNGLGGAFLEKLKVEEAGNIVCLAGTLDLVALKYCFTEGWVESWSRGQSVVCGVGFE